MKLKELTKTFVMISNEKNLVSMVFVKVFQRFNPFTTEARFYVLNAMAFST